MNIYVHSRDNEYGLFVFLKPHKTFSYFTKIQSKQTFYYINWVREDLNNNNNNFQLLDL